MECSSLHSFGGRMLDRFVFDFDPDDGLGDAAADVGAAAAPSPDHEAPAGEAGESLPSGDATEAAAQPSEPAFDPREIQAEIEFLRGQNQQLAQLVQGYPPSSATEAGADASPTLDPFADDYSQQLAALIQQTVAQAVQPLSATFQQQQQAAAQAESEQRVQDVIADDVARNGEFVTGDTDEQKAADRQARQLVRTLAEQSFPEYAARYGAGDRAAAFAIEKAAAQVRSLLAAAGQTAVARHQNHLGTLAGAPGEVPGVGGAAATEQPVVKIGSRVVDRYAAA